MINLFIIFILSLYVNKPVEIKITPTQTPTPSPTEDPRTQKIKEFLKSKNSPLASASADFVKFGDQFKIDPAILVGISKSESNFEKAGNVTDNNPFGYNCPGTRPCQKFPSFRVAIQQLARTLRHHRAYQEFQKTGRVEDIAKRYLRGNKERWIATVEETVNKLN